MTTIVMDLEFCKIGRKNKEQRAIAKHEIIQIGAVKLDDSLNITEKFDLLVRPDYGHIDYQVESLTHLNDAKVSKGVSFAEAMDRFIEWMGEDEITCCSWSMEDREQIIHESALKSYAHPKLPSILENWVDLQKMFGEQLHVDQQVSLHNAMKGAGIIFIGQEHSAVDDAENTAYIYQMMQDEEGFRKKMAPLIELMTPTEELSFSLGSLLKDIQLDN